MADISFLTARPIAHRGLHDGNVAVPENTWTACQAAIEGGFGIEIDVQLSRDGHAVVFHDVTLGRLCRRKEAVADLTAAELAEISVAGTDQTIERLDTIIARIDGRVPVVVEMKDNGDHNAALAQSVAATLKPLKGTVAAMSFAQDLMTRFIEHAPDIPAGLTAEGTTDTALKPHYDFMATETGQKISFISYNVLHLPNGFVATMRETNGLPVITWTVRAPELKSHSDTHADQITFEGFDPLVL